MIELFARGGARKRTVTFVDSLNIALKRLILASRFPSRFLDPITQLLKMGEFLRAGNLRGSVKVADRYQLYALIQSKLQPNAPIDYLEFGVFEGTSIRSWVEANRHSESRFYGFDTFEGLPERWRQNATYALPAGYFSTHGIPPDIRDSRVRWVKGMFQETLEGFAATYQPRNRLILHFDADLYTSTLCALAVMNRFLVPGTVLIFDEFDSVTGEFRAFCDYSASFRKKFVTLGHCGEFCEQVAFLVDGPLGNLCTSVSVRA